jgi:hypothetical protein
MPFLLRSLSQTETIDEAYGLCLRNTKTEEDSLCGSMARMTRTTDLQSGFVQ